MYPAANTKNLAYLFAQQLRELGGHRVHAQTVHDLFLGAAEVARKDNLGSLTSQEIDGGASGAQPGCIGYLGR